LKSRTVTEMTMHEKIRGARRKTRVSQAEVGLAFGKSQTWYARIERGLVPIDEAMSKRIIKAIRLLAEQREAVSRAASAAAARVRADFENLKMRAEGRR
jgi:transcriptional regulator with XRE-family HTH domain